MLLEIKVASPESPASKTIFEDVPDYSIPFLLEFVRSLLHHKEFFIGFIAFRSLYYKFNNVSNYSISFTI